MQEIHTPEYKLQDIRQAVNNRKQHYHKKQYQRCYYLGYSQLKGLGICVLATSS